MRTEDNPRFIAFYDWLEANLGLAKLRTLSDDAIVKHFNKYSNTTSGSNPLLEQAAQDAVKTIRRRKLGADTAETSNGKKTSRSVQEQEGLKKRFYGWLDDKLTDDTLFAYDDVRLTNGSIFDCASFFKLLRAFLASEGIEKQEQEPYLDRMHSLLEKGTLYKHVIEHFADKGLNLRVSKALTSRAILDYMERPLHAVILSPSEDHVVEKYIKENASELNKLTGKWCDIHVFKSEGDGLDLIDKLDVIQQAGFQAISQFPGLFFWDSQRQTEYIPLDSWTSKEDIRKIMWMIFEKVRQAPSISSVTYVKSLLARMSSSPSNTSFSPPESISQRPIDLPQAPVLSLGTQASPAEQDRPAALVPDKKPWYADTGIQFLIGGLIALGSFVWAIIEFFLK